MESYTESKSAYMPEGTFEVELLSPTESPEEDISVVKDNYSHRLQPQ